MPTPLKPNEIEYDGDNKTIIKGDAARELRKSLVHKPAQTYAEFSDGDTFMRPHEIEIDDNGRVIIDNKDFQVLVKKRVTEAEAANPSDPVAWNVNCNC